MKDLKLAMVQMRSIVGDIDGNFKRMNGYIDIAIKKKPT